VNQKKFLKGWSNLVYLGRRGYEEMKAIGCVILSFFALAGCGPILPNTPSMVVRTYPFNPAGKMILIQHFDFNPAIATNVDRPSVEKFGELIAFDIQKYLKRAGFKNPLVVQAKEPLEGDFLIKGTITGVSGGNIQQRKYLEWFGFGATEVKVVGEVLDIKTSLSLVAFSFTKQSHFTRKANEAAVRENIGEIAQEIAQVILQNPK
jgi:hypothetical protein